jgi:hypothetical protein
MSVGSRIFCRIVQKQVSASLVFEDEKVMAFLDIRPLNEGHTLVIPKAHYESILRYSKGAHRVPSQNHQKHSKRRRKSDKSGWNQHNSAKRKSCWPRHISPTRSRHSQIRGAKTTKLQRDFRCRPKKPKQNRRENTKIPLTMPLTTSSITKHDRTPKPLQLQNIA